jgi:hypothetical protein
MYGDAILFSFAFFSKLLFSNWWTKYLRIYSNDFLEIYRYHIFLIIRSRIWHRIFFHWMPRSFFIDFCNKILVKIRVFLITCNFYKIKLKIFPHATLEPSPFFTRKLFKIFRMFDRKKFHHRQGFSKEGSTRRYL